MWLWVGILLADLVGSVTCQILQRESWHQLTVASQTLNLSLTSPGFLEAEKFCFGLQSNGVTYEFENCLSLALQSHRTLRQSYIETHAAEIGLETHQFSRLLAYSYAFESCPGSPSGEPQPNHDPNIRPLPPLPIDVCFFGEISPLVILQALLSCDRYRLNFFNIYDAQTQLKLILWRQHFPHREIRWIPGHYSAFFPPPFSSPLCHVIHLTPQSATEFSLLDSPPVPTPLPLPPSSDPELYSHFPCQGSGMVLLLSPIPAPSATTDDGDSLRLSLAQRYNNSGVTLDWRLHVISADTTTNLSKKDSEGFLYRLMQRYSDSPSSRLDISCAHPSSPPSPSLHALFAPASCPDIVISYCNRVFSETARGFQQAIERASPRLRVAVWADMNLALLNSHCRDNGRGSSTPLPLQIAIAPHEETPLLPRYVVLQMEQTWSDYMEDPRFQSILRRAEAVWTFSRQQHQLLSSPQIGIPVSRLRSLPLYTDRRYADETETLSGKSEGDSDSRPIDLLFFGSGSPRRQQFAEQIAEFAASHNLLLAGRLGGAEVSLFGQTRDQLVRLSKIVVNIHTESSSALEVHRLNYLLSMGACVLSEPSSDPDMDAQYGSAVVFASSEAIPEAVLELLRDEDKRRRTLWSL